MCEVPFGTIPITFRFGCLQPAPSSTAEIMQTKRLLRTPSAVDQDVGPGYEGGAVRAQEPYETADLFDLAPAAHGDLGHELGVNLRVLHQCSVHFGPERPRADRDHRYALGCEF